MLYSYYQPIEPGLLQFRKIENSSDQFPMEVLQNLQYQNLEGIITSLWQTKLHVIVTQKQLQVTNSKSYMQNNVV